MAPTSNSTISRTPTTTGDRLPEEAICPLVDDWSTIKWYWGYNPRILREYGDYIFQYFWVSAEHDPEQAPNFVSIEAPWAAGS